MRQGYSRGRINFIRSMSSKAYSIRSSDSRL
jgi:hypothetical protein